MEYRLGKNIRWCPLCGYLEAKKEDVMLETWFVCNEDNAMKIIKVLDEHGVFPA
jgi:hypothetical protein